MPYVKVWPKEIVAKNLDYDYRPRIAVVGSRNYLQWWRIPTILYENFGDEDVIIVSGGADGADSAAKYSAGVLGLGYKEFLPKYILYGRKAPLYRNIEIAEYCTQAVAFWDGKSRGTKHLLATVRALEKPFVVIGEQ